MEKINSESLLCRSEENKNLICNTDTCDRYDYLTAVACGAIGGLIDIFLVGSPGDSPLGRWTDQQVDNVVMAFARKMGWNPTPKNANNVKSAIGFLEHGRNNGKPGDFQGFKVNYDQRKPGDVDDLFTIAPKTHHMMSLAHSPDIIGLFFSVLNQFTSTATFIANGQLITVNTSSFELQGGNFVAKIFCGVANWFGHLMSDVAGSSGSHGRGTGIVMPFYELFGLCKFGNFGQKDLSEIAMQAFTEGYDFRFGLAQSIPVLTTDLSIRLIWTIRQHFQFGKPLKECIPNATHNSLRVMILFGHGTLCLMDGADAAIRSGGNWLLFFMRMNLMAWTRFSALVLKEICIRLGIAKPLQRQINAYSRIVGFLQAYHAQLKELDIERFRKETEEYNQWVSCFDRVSDENQLNIILRKTMIDLDIPLPWSGDFDTFMNDKTAHLVFQ